eukprot:2744967-Rhodomonas_salina.3
MPLREKRREMWMDGWMDGWMDEGMEGGMERWVEGGGEREREKEERKGNGKEGGRLTTSRGKTAVLKASDIGCKPHLMDRQYHNVTVTQRRRFHSNARCEAH